jgi:hypothetical protein
MTESAKVVTLFGEPMWLPGEPIETIVKMIEEALALARAGSLRSCSIAYTIDDGSPVPLPGCNFGAASGHLSYLFGANSRVGMRMLKAMEGE